MAQYYTDFSEYTTNTSPGDWTQRWQSGGSRTVRADGSRIGGKYLEWVKSGNSRHAVSWDALDADGNRADFEILCRLFIPSATDLTGGIIGRGAGSASSETGYYSRYVDGSVFQNLARYNAGNNTSLGNGGSITKGNWYWFRHQTRGSNHKIKSWLGDLEDEPGSWGLETTNSDVSAAGWIGIWAFSAHTLLIDVFAVGTGSDSAPTGPVGGGEEVEVSASIPAVSLAGTAAVERTVSAALVTSALTLAAAGTVDRSVSGDLHTAALQLAMSAEAVREVSAALGILPLELAASTVNERSAEVTLVLPSPDLSAGSAAERSAVASLAVQAPELLSDLIIARTAAAALQAPAAQLDANLGADKAVSASLSLEPLTAAADSGVERRVSAELEVPALELQAQVSIVRLASGELALLVPVLAASVAGQELTATAALRTPVPVLDVDAAISRTASGELSVTAFVLDGGVSRAARVEGALVVTAPSLECQAALQRLASAQLTVSELEMVATVFDGAIQRVIGVRGVVESRRTVVLVPGSDRIVLVGPRDLQ